MLSNDKSLIFRTDSGEHLDFVVQKIFFSFCNKIIINSISLPPIILELKVGYIIPLLFKFIIDILQLNYITRVGKAVVISSFNNNDFIILLNHTRKDGSLNSKKNIITCNDFSIDFCLSKSGNCAFCIIF